AEVSWSLIGHHNAENALAVMAAAEHVGIQPELTAEALAAYKSVKRRLQKLAVLNGVTVYDDFAHHPTAIAATLSGLRASLESGRIISVFEPRSNSM
ncbi:MAG: UDP-N-acetylmuramate:L-alanyl-gamma-D-glutamyl-meso-diaminopimelate ligase, partial [Gammaproteobacteria bacterium]|nr:UDP-N-acetylmuramate:L-alanyl-gamma-D-glutamyl-meso-diaminopimelate ligase [Gammaproteobacteria bacterium]NIO63362.1 UDP-N-acetylmuramate:L-alanyl-gamma-D-glutamyl-meso-diaminopimelate ligase [Gammaproteobacteria bacterium]